MKTITTRTPGGFFGFLRKHPYLLTILICMVLLPFSYADRARITTTGCILLGAGAAIAAVAVIFCFHFGKTTSEKIILSIICSFCAAAAVLVICLVDNKAVAIAAVALIVAIIAAVFIKINFELNDTVVIAVLILLGVTIRFVYVLYTSAADRQHDVGTWGGTAGHTAYIEYWNNNGFKLPDFDVRNYWQFYHPPLHHWLMATLLSVLSALGVPYPTACEALQILPMLYSSLVMIVSYRIFRLIKLSGKPLIAAMAIVCFHPTFILFGGAFNNDMLLMLFVMSAIMWGLRWFREPVMKNIIPLALCIGLGMMTKLSGWMVAPAVAFLFLYILIKNIKKPLRYIGQYAVFGVICVPLGLWWQVRNLLLFKVPLTYVPNLGTGSEMYSGNMSVAQRLFDFGNGQLSYVYDAITLIGGPYNEYNPTVGLFKTAMFDEGTKSINNINFPQITVTGPILFWLSVALFLISFVCFVIMMIKKSKDITGTERIYFSLIFAVHLISYYMFCFSYPFSCTLNIRYCMPLIPLCAMGLGMMLKSTEKNTKPAATVFRRFMYVLTAAFCGMSYLVYTQVGFTI